MTNVQSVVTPANGGKVSTKAFRAKANGSTAATPIVAKDVPMTVEQAVEACFEYGGSMAGLDGNLTKALQTFKDQKEPQRQMFRGMCIGYLCRKLGYNRDHATVRYDLLKHNPTIEQDDKHRNAEEQRVIDSVRMMWSRANAFAGTSPARSEKQEKALEAAQVAAEQRKAHAEAAQKAWEIVHPNEAAVEEVTPQSVIDTLVRLAQTIKVYANKHSALIQGDAGSAWREWIAAAPVAMKPAPKTGKRK